MIRTARPDDVAHLLRLVRELAVYEREPDAVGATEPLLHEALFGSDPSASCLVAETEGAVVGLALWFLHSRRGSGVRACISRISTSSPLTAAAGSAGPCSVALAAIAADRGWGRVDWQVLDWNVDAQAFYRSLGANSLNDWTTYRIDGAALTRLATQSSADRSRRS